MSKNAYFMFMLDFKRKEENACGHSLSMADVAILASSSWAALSDVEREIYRNKAKNPSESGSVNDSISGRSNRSDPSTQLREAKQARMVEENRVIDRINNMMKCTTMNKTTNITKMPILLMYGNFFYSTTSGEYSPAEIAIGRFTFETGITKRFHTFINPGRPRIGYAYAAKVHSEQTHGIPVPFSANDGLGEKDLNIVHDRIQDFLCLNGHKFDDGKYLVFAHSDQYSREDDQVAVLKSFMTSMSPKNCLEIDIFPLDRLFDALRTHMINIGRVHGLPNENHVKPIMSCEKFYKDIPGLACDLHRGYDRSRFCALTHISRWAFTLAEHFCERLEVPLVAGKHVPRTFTSNSSIGFASTIGSQSSVCGRQSMKSASEESLDTASRSSVFASDIISRTSKAISDSDSESHFSAS